MRLYQIGDYASLRQFINRHLRRTLPFATPAKTLNALKGLLAMVRGKALLSSLPFVFRIDVSAVCNLRCPPCQTWRVQKELLPGERLMSLKTFERVIEQIRSSCLRVSLYDSGEPLMNPEIYRMIARANAAGLSSSISTNFTLFEPDDLEPLFDSGLSHLEVCLDGFSQAAYGHYRVGGDVERVKRNIELVGRYKKEKGFEYPEIDVQVVKFKHIEAEIPAIIDFCRRAGVDSVTLREENLGFEKEPQEIPERGKRSSGRRKRCYWLWVGMLIKADGRVSPCCARRPVFGDIRRQSLPEIWNSPLYVESRKAVADPSSTPCLPTPCAACDFYL